MSGSDGAEPPLDVDARFADIIAHFHDDEPTRPTVVDAFDGTDAADGTDGVDGTGSAAGTDATAAPVGTDDPRSSADQGRTAGTTDALRPDPTSPDASRGAAASGRPGTSSDPVKDLSAPADLAAMRRSYEARIAAEVDRAVDGPDGGHFVPADPPPLPRPDLPGRLAWTAVLLGPAVLLLCALLWQVAPAPSWLLGAIVTAIVAGFGYLVWRLPSTRDRDDPGDGAIV